jgi:hypothetical protein
LFVCRLVCLFVGWQAGWLAGWLADLFIYWLIDLLIGWLFEALQPSMHLPKARICWTEHVGYRFTNGIAQRAQWP